MCKYYIGTSRIKNKNESNERKKNWLTHVYMTVCGWVRSFIHSFFCLFVIVIVKEARMRYAEEEHDDDVVDDKKIHCLFLLIRSMSFFSFFFLCVECV